MPTKPTVTDFRRWIEQLLDTLPAVWRLSHAEGDSITPLIEEFRARFRLLPEPQAFRQAEVLGGALQALGFAVIRSDADAITTLETQVLAILRGETGA